jgi:membrane fusion protein (multidrug efflux system)
MSSAVTADDKPLTLRRDMARLRMRRAAVAGVALAVAAIGASWYGYDWWTQGRFIETTDDAYVGGNVTPIAPHVSGYVAQVLVKDNQLVAAGQPLIRLQQKDYRATLAHARAVVAAGIAALAGLRAQYALQQSAIREQAAELGAKQAQADFAVIRAPIAGYVGNRAAQVGAYVTPGTYLMSLIPSAGLWVDANFKEDQLAHMTAGEPVTVVADLLPGHTFRGHVGSLAPATGAVFSVIPPENATGNFTKIVQRVPVRVRLDAGDPALRLLRPGLSTTVSVDTRADAR